MRLCELIKSARLNKGMSQAQLAGRLNVTTMFVSAMEREASKVPFDKLKIMIKLFKMDKKMVIDSILNDHEKMIVKELL